MHPFLAAVVFLATPALADEISMVRIGEPWRFLKGTNEASQPVTAWRTRSFDDTAWESGPAGFSLATDEATRLTQPPAFGSAFFRKTFTVTDPGTVRWLTLRLDYSSGFVASSASATAPKTGTAFASPLHTTPRSWPSADRLTADTSVRSSAASTPSP